MRYGFYAEIKITGPKASQCFTVLTILKNFAFIAGLGKAIIVMIPLVQNESNTTENRLGVQEFVHSFNKEIPIEYIHFNPLVANNFKGRRFYFHCRALEMMIIH